MKRLRKKYFELSERSEVFDFGTYALLMYYAKGINSVKAKQLMDLTMSEFYYRLNKDLPTDDLTSDDDEVYFIPSQLQEVIDFIDNELITSLEKEPQSLLKKYINRDHFYQLFNTNMGFLDYIGIGKDEYYDDDPRQLILLINVLKAFMQYSLSVNLPYSVYVI